MFKLFVWLGLIRPVGIGEKTSLGQVMVRNMLTGTIRTVPAALIPRRSGRAPRKHRRKQLTEPK